MNSKEVMDAFDKYVVNTGARFPVVYDHAEGAKVWDKDGKEYIEMCAGYGANSLGYADPEWLDAVCAQLKKFQHTSNLYYHEIGAVVSQKEAA